jgi:hypothetical protein
MAGRLGFNGMTGDAQEAAENGTSAKIRTEAVAKTTKQNSAGKVGRGPLNWG